MDRLMDEVLVGLCLNGDREAFAEIVRRYQKQIYSLTFRLTNDSMDAQDLAQEVFLHLYQVLEKFDGSRKFFSWMYKVATNYCYTALRKKAPNEISLEKIIDFTPLRPGDHGQPEDQCEVKETQMLVREAISQLPEKYRIPLVLRYLEEFSYRQISDAMDVPVTTVETRLYRGKALLQKKLAIVLERGGQNEMSGN
ncbi:sigma-70 family RNA polymerase sigma factor [Metallumcola ferriviriculae]|uniref:Sigma-70 family RNA polymerase sigma factor n=1 Tax=Metallumcola ferriviriculae TaxID=3039180 RepID=A0AAU0UKG4_9FIRM|nr:sigma-70 family RNA polymerase sigma factor [Desulfitibacteraceae bacterium MK1]